MLKSINDILFYTKKDSDFKCSCCDHQLHDSLLKIKEKKIVKFVQSDIKNLCAPHNKKLWSLNNNNYQHKITNGTIINYEYLEHININSYEMAKSIKLNLCQKKNIILSNLKTFTIDDSNNFITNEIICDIIIWFFPIHINNLYPSLYKIKFNKKILVSLFSKIFQHFAGYDYFIRNYISISKNYNVISNISLELPFSTHDKNKNLNHVFNKLSKTKCFIFYTPRIFYSFNDSYSEGFLKFEVHS